MGNASKIEWTDASWTPIRARNLKTRKVGWHCEHVTTGCEFCYSEGMNKRLGTGLPFKPGHRKDIEIFLDEEMLLAPLRWKKPRMIFVCSMTDAFADFVTDEWLDKMFAIMWLTPQHTYQLLTKRPARMQEYLTMPHRKRRIENACDDLSRMDRKLISLEHFTRCFEHDLPLPNVWLGVSTERQQEADERIPLLLQTPAAVRFISAEPLLGPIDLKNIGGDGITEHDALSGEHLFSDVPQGVRLDWIIVGGESGPNARPMHPQWARDIRDQCEAAGVTFFFKQWGEHAAVQVSTGPATCQRVWMGDHFVTGHDFEDGWFAARVGKKTAGRLLDGKEHNGFPQAREIAFG